MEEQSGDDRQLMTNAIAHLVERNVLRYTTGGMLTWHRKVEEHHFKIKKYFKATVVFRDILSNLYIGSIVVFSCC